MYVGYKHALALKSNGEAWAWGLNISGELGNNSPDSSKSSPVAVIGTI